LEYSVLLTSAFQMKEANLLLATRLDVSSTVPVFK
jgi:hypothetical protein